MKLSAVMFLAFSILFSANPVLSKLLMLADSFEITDVTPNFPMTMKNMHIRLSNKTGSYIVGEVHIFEDIPNSVFQVFIFLCQKNIFCMS